MQLTPDSNDQEILNQTQQDDTFIWVTLADGHQIKATKPMKFVDWCGAVRNSIAARVESVEAERKARAARGPLTESGGSVPVPTSKRRDPVDPVSHAKEQAEYWSGRLHELKEQLEELQEELEFASKSFGAWDSIAKELELKFRPAQEEEDEQ